MVIFNEITKANANILMLQTNSLIANDVVQNMNCNLYRYGGLLSCIRKDVYKVSMSFVVSPIYNGFNVGVGIVQACSIASDKNGDQVLVFGNLMLNHPPTSLKIQDRTFIESFSSQVENIIGKGKHFSAKTKKNFIFSVYKNETDPMVPERFENIRFDDSEVRKHMVVYRLSQHNPETSYRLKSSSSTDQRLYGVSATFSVPHSSHKQPKIAHYVDENINGRTQLLQSQWATKVISTLRAASTSRREALNEIFTVQDLAVLGTSHSKEYLSEIETRVAHLTSLILNVTKSTRTLLVSTKDKGPAKCPDIEEALQHG